MHRIARHAVFILLCAASAAAWAQSAVPLVIIRFNQPNVYYDQQLYTALSKAVAVKADLLVDVVAYAPQTGNAQVDKAWQAKASQDAQGVVATLEQLGVPRSRVTVTGQPQPGLRFDETHIYVK